jgi:quinol monooxygenase YgiN
MYHLVNNSEKTLFVSFEPKDAEAAVQFGEVLNALYKLSQSEEGMVRYEIFRPEDDCNEYYVMETWSCERTLQQHLRQPHLIAFAELCKILLARPHKVIAMKQDFFNSGLQKIFAGGVNLN